MKKELKIISYIFSVFFVSLILTSCGKNLSKSELKNNFYYMEDQYAQVFIDSQKI